MAKKIILFVITLIPWFLSGFFIRDTTFYETLTKPPFAPPAFLFGIVWTILFILLALSITIIYSSYRPSEIRSYTKALIFNYIFNQLFTILFFGFHNIFLGFVDTVAVFLTSLFVYYETKELNQKASKLLIPYVFWCLFATILSMTIYFLNL